jgi:integrase/recombinase XerC
MSTVTTVATERSFPLARLSASAAGHDLDQPTIIRARLQAAMERLAPGTRRAYGLALRRFSEFAASEVGVVVREWWDLIIEVTAMGRLVTSHVADRYAAAMTGHLAPATIAQRLAAVRWAVGLLDEAGVIGWTLRIRSPRVRGYRDVRGPMLEDVRALLVAADQGHGILAPRDRVLVGVLFSLGLRRGEVTTLRIRDWDRDRLALAVVGKGRTQREWLTVPAGLAAEIDAYLAARAPLPSQNELDAPLIAGHGPRSTGRALGGDGILRALARLSRRARLKRVARPHGLRHAAITAALDLNHGDVRRVARFSRHAKLETLMVYDDARRDHAGEVAGGLEKIVRDPSGKPAESRE